MVAEDTITERETIDLAIERCEESLLMSDKITARHALGWLIENVQMCGWLDELRARVNG